MSCGCTSITNTSSSVTCGSCGYQCTSCVCPPDPIVMPTVTCETPATCTEIYPLECVQYTGDDIKCSTESSTLYPNVTHIVATTDDSLSTVLNNINNQLCYMFSVDFINQMLTNIRDNNDLSSLICSLTDSCGAAPTALICPTVNTLTYNISSPQNYLQTTFNYVPYATSYNYKIYVEDTPSSNTYTAVLSGVLQQPSIALPISINSPLTGTSYTSTRKYIVLVQAVSSTLTSSGPDLATTYTGSTLTNIQYNTIFSTFDPTKCGFNTYTYTESQTCLLDYLRFYNIEYNDTIQTIQFSFTQQAQVPSVNIPIVSYVVHWYFPDPGSSPVIYKYGGRRDISFNALNQETIDIYKRVISTYTKSSFTVTVTSTGHGLSTGTKIYVHFTDTIATPVGYYTITVINANTFTFITTNNTAGSGTLRYEGSKLLKTDDVVVMVQTLTESAECYKGLPPSAEFNLAEINTFYSNPNYQVYINF